ncbi:sorting nexin-8-like [Oscarella lobularis]|uniref:sorting nexin-8-like n=1 Tax=Oscarella lobularis TaxID=121494 RepID=UPI0033141497
MAGLLGGSIPSLYREIYEVLCPDGSTKIPQAICIRALSKSGLPKAILSEIWQASDSKGQGSLNRDGLYKALALTAVAQKGKPPTEKSLDVFQDTELPKPKLGELSNLTKMTLEIDRQSNPTVLGFTYDDLVAMDTLYLSVIPGKKGLIVKHVEFTLDSQLHGTSVHRRYSDFEVLHELLMARFPYRLVPRLPPKKMNPSRSFIEARRRALQRYINLVCRHPVLSDDDAVNFFVVFSGSDFQHKLKDKFRSIPDEFVTSPNGPRAKELAPLDMHAGMSGIREQIRQMQSSVTQLREVARRIVERSEAMSQDMRTFQQELSSISSESAPSTAWSRGSEESWGRVKRGLNGSLAQFGTLSDKYKEKGSQEYEGLYETLSMFLALINAYQDLVERREKGVMREHQIAISRMHTLKKHQDKLHARKDNLAPEIAFTADKLEGHIMTQEDHIHNVEMRNYFSLYCLYMESQLVSVNMDMLAVALQEMVDTQLRTDQQVHDVWEQLKPAMNALLPKRQIKSPVKKKYSSAGFEFSPPGTPP